MKIAILAAATAAMLSFMASPAEASATLQVNGSGQLTGASGVIVGSSVYDVQFIDNTCAAIFSGCDSISDLNFTTLADSELAAQALLDQVLIDSGAGQFDSDYTLTFGCSTNVSLACRVTIPYGIIPGAGFTNQALNTNTTDMTNLALLNPNENFGTEPGLVYAFFTRTGAVAVPEPATWAMMLLGFGAIGFAMRRRRRPDPLPVV